MASSSITRSSSRVRRKGIGRKTLNSWARASRYLAMPGGQLSALARSLTLESNPQQTTPANHSCAPILAASTVRGRIRRTVSAAADGSATGRPRAPAMSLPVPAGMMPSGTPVPATACTARWASPSPPKATSASGPAATARRARSRASSALVPTITDTSAPPSRRRRSTGASSRRARPPRAVGLNSRASWITPGTYRLFVDIGIGRAQIERGRLIVGEPGEVVLLGQALLPQVHEELGHGEEQHHGSGQRHHRDWIAARSDHGAEDEHEEDHHAAVLG